MRADAGAPTDFDYIYNADGTCHWWDCGKQGLVLAYDDFSPECGLWFCADHWSEYEDTNILTIVEDKRHGSTLA